MLFFFILLPLKVGASCTVPAGFEHLGDDSNDYYKMDSVDRDFFASASNCAGLGGTLVGPTSRDMWDALFSHFEGEQYSVSLIHSPKWVLKGRSFSSSVPVRYRPLAQQH